MAYIILTRDFGGVEIQSAIYVDAVVSETHARTARPTTHPLEDGTDVADHVILDPLTLTMEARIDSVPVLRSLLELPMDEVGRVVRVARPVYVQGSMRKQIHPPEMSGGFSPPYRAPGAPGFQTAVYVAPARWVTVPTLHTGMGYSAQGSINSKFATTRVREVYEALRDCVVQRKVVAVVTDLQSYKDLIITKLSAPREATDSLTFTLEFTGLTFAKTAEVSFINVAPLEARAKAEQKTVAAEGVDMSAIGGEEFGSSLQSKLTQLAAEAFK